MKHANRKLLQTAELHKKVGRRKQVSSNLS